MGVRTYQAVAEAPSTPPLSPAFKEGWYSERAPIRRASSSVWQRHEQATMPLSTPPLSPAFKEGWYSERAPIRRASSSVWQRHEQAAMPLPYSTPTVALPEGWYSERAPIRPTFRFSARDEWVSTIVSAVSDLTEGWSAYRSIPRTSSIRLPSQVWDFFVVVSSPQGWWCDGDRYGQRLPALVKTNDQRSYTVLSVPPLAPAFKEGWQTNDRGSKTLYYSRSLPKDEWQSFTVTAAVVVTTAQGWWSEVRTTRPASRTIVSVDSQLVTAAVVVVAAAVQGWQAEVGVPVKPAYHAASSTDLLDTPILIPQGWWSEVRTTRPASRTIVSVDSQLVTPVFIPQGWWTEASSSKSRSKRKADYLVLDPLPLVTKPFVEGWQSDRFILHPQQVRREDRYDWQQLFVLPVIAAPVVGSIIWTGVSNLDIVWLGRTNLEIVWTGRTA